MTNNTRSDKGTFILRCDCFEQIKILSREQRGDLLTAIFAHASGAELPPMDGVTNMCFVFIRASIDSYSEKYNAKCLKNKENGRRGGRPRKETEGQSEEPDESEKTERFSNDDGKSEKTERVKKNHDSDSDSDSDSELYCCTTAHTHTVVSEKGVVGGNAVGELLSWIAANAPTIASMAEPINEQHARWMLRKYEVEDIRRVIMSMHSRGAYKGNTHAYTVFSAYAGMDFIIKDRQAGVKNRGRLLTYEQKLNLLPTNGGRYTEKDFELVSTPDGNRWRLKIPNP